MSTRGAYGFRINSQDKITYNHCDSYPTGLLHKIILFIRDTSDNELNNIANKIILVKPNDYPTQILQRKYEKYSDTGVFY